MSAGFSNHDMLVRVLLIGDSGVGKSSLLLRFVNDSFTRTYISTIGIDFKLKMIEQEGQKVKMQIWDTAGQERFARVLLPTYFRKAKGVILVYYITNAKNFESLSERWMIQLNEHASSDELAKLLVGNMSDLEGSREVPREKH